MGPILSRLYDLRNPEVDIDAMRPEVLEFTLQVAADGTPTPSALSPTLSGYILAIHTIEAWQAGGAVAGSLAPSLVTFNPREVGRAQSVFRRPATIQGYLGPQGASFYMPYRCFPGTDFDVVWTVATTWAALVNAQATFGVRVLADYYRCPNESDADQVEWRARRDAARAAR